VNQARQQPDAETTCTSTTQDVRVCLPATQAADQTEETEAGYVSSLAPRPHALVPPSSHPSRLAELGAMVAWTTTSWLSSAGANAVKKQSPDRGNRRR